MPGEAMNRRGHATLAEYVRSQIGRYVTEREALQMFECRPPVERIAAAVYAVKLGYYSAALELLNSAAVDLQSKRWLS